MLLNLVKPEKSQRRFSTPLLFADFTDLLTYFRNHAPNKYGSRDADGGIVAVCVKKSRRDGLCIG